LKNLKIKTMPVDDSEIIEVEQKKLEDISIAVKNI
jgi:hypothetical protein